MNSKTYGFSKRTARMPEKVQPTDRGSLVAGVPLAGILPRKLKERVELVMLTAPRSIAAEKFRRLGSTLTDKTSDELTVVVTSAAPNEGKTTVALNLALALCGDTDGETLVIDADLRRPTIHSWLEPPPGLGLSDVLSGKVGLEHTIQELTNSDLKVLPAGSAREDPLELLATKRMRELMATLRERYRQIVVDTPPIVPFADAVVMGRHCDGILLVARSGLTEKKAYQHAVSLLASKNIFGVVLNQYTHSIVDRGVNQDSYYSAYYRREDR